MTYSQEYKDWTKSDVTADFSIKEVSHNMRPGDETDVSCDGIGFDGMIKVESGALFLKMRIEGTSDHEYVGFMSIKNQYVSPEL